MNDPAIPGPLRRGRLAALLAVLAVAMAAAALVLPQGLIRLVLLGVLALPAIAVLIDRPLWIFHILVFLLFSNIDMFFPFRLYRYMSFFLIGAVILSAAAGRRLVLRDRVFLVLSAAMLIAMVQSIAFAVDLRAAIHQVSIFARVLVVTLITPLVVRERRDLVVLFAVIVAAVLISALLPLVVPPPEQFASRSLIWGEGVLRYEGYVGEANFFAFNLVFYVPLLLFLFAKFRRPRLLRPTLLVGLGASFYVLAMSFSRGGFVSMAAAMIVLLILERRNRAVLITGVSTLAVGLAAAPAIYWERISSLVEAMRNPAFDPALLSRYETMRVALLLGLRNPLFGVGPDNFMYQASRFIAYTQDVHNAFLQAFAELGIPGFAVLTALVVWNFRVIRGMMRVAADQETSLLGRMLFVQQAAVVVNAMFLPAVYHHVFWMTLVLPTVARCAYIEPSGDGPGGAPAVPTSR